MGVTRNRPMHPLRMEELLNAAIIILAIVVVLIVVNMANNRGISRISGEAAREMISSAGATLIDVRTPEEFRQGHIEGAMLMPLDEIGARIGELAALKDRPVLLYCRGGNRSLVAGRILRKSGFVKISNLRGGIMAWSNKGFPIIKGER
jgi:rhodanese-related sulfurtransferase